MRSIGIAVCLAAAATSTSAWAGDAAFCAALKQVVAAAAEEPAFGSVAAAGNLGAVPLFGGAACSIP